MSISSWIVNYNDLMKSSLKCVSKISINNVSTLVQVMALWRISAKLLPESLMTTIHLDAIWLHYRIGHCNQWWLVYWRIYASLGLSELDLMGMEILLYLINLSSSFLLTWVNTGINWISAFWSTKSLCFDRSYEYSRGRICFLTLANSDRIRSPSKQDIAPCHDHRIVLALRTHQSLVPA